MRLGVGPFSVVVVVVVVVPGTFVSDGGGGEMDEIVTVCVCL